MDISEIFRKFAPQYIKPHGQNIPFNHVKTIDAIINCRTSSLGGVVHYCEKCKKLHYSYHSCKNRHCPTCGSQDSKKWLEKQKKKLLPVPYFMVTFTLPKELRNICRSNQRKFYSYMFKASSSALRTLLRDPKFAGGEAGFTGVLHTWTRQCHYHPHIHYIVPAGAFDFKRNQWNKANHKFLIPVKALSKIYRGNLQKLLKSKAANLYHQIPQFVWKEKKFITNSIPVGKGEEAFTYLANYIYKTAITNNRIINCRNGKVTFKYKDSKTNETQFKTISALEFIRRFLQHVLPSGFQKVRYYGFISSASKEKWKIVANNFSINLEEDIEQKASQSFREVFCRHCHSKMIVYASIIRKQRPPPYIIISKLTQQAS